MTSSMGETMMLWSTPMGGRSSCLRLTGFPSLRPRRRREGPARRDARTSPGFGRRADPCGSQTLVGSKSPAFNTKKSFCGKVCRNLLLLFGRIICAIFAPPNQNVLPHLVFLCLWKEFPLDLFLSSLVSPPQVSCSRCSFMRGNSVNCSDSKTRTRIITDGSDGRDSGSPSFFVRRHARRTFFFVSCS